MSTNYAQFTLSAYTYLTTAHDIRSVIIVINSAQTLRIIAYCDVTLGLRVRDVYFECGGWDFVMDSIGMDLQLSERATSEYEKALQVPLVDEEQQKDSDSNKSPSPEPQSVASVYHMSSDLAAGTTVPVGEQVFVWDRRPNKTSTSSTSSSSDSESRGGASLYIPEYLTPSMSYERQTPEQLLIALIGRAFDQPEKTASFLQDLVEKVPQSNVAVAKFIPFTVKRKALCRGNFDSRELKKHDLICMCYNASEARILLTGQDGFYSSLLRQVEIMMGRCRVVKCVYYHTLHLPPPPPPLPSAILPPGPNKVVFLISNYTPPPNHPHQATKSTDILSPPLKTRLSLQLPLRPYLDRGQVFSWGDQPDTRQAEKLVQIARLEPNPQGLLSVCSLM